MYIRLYYKFSRKRGKWNFYVKRLKFSEALKANEQKKNCIGWARHHKTQANVFSIFLQTYRYRTLPKYFIKVVFTERKIAISILRNCSRIH